MPLETGQVLHERYRIEARLGQGGMGAVYRAWDNNLNIPVAVKENLDGSPEAQKQFNREAHLLARLVHLNLPRVIDTFFVPGQGQYLVMDYVDGEDLQAMLQRLGTLPEDRVLVWVSQICDALNYLHRQPSPVIHRDIKPANIKIRPDGRAMLVDFGIAKVYDPHLATTIGARAVTPGYSPPEQYGGGATDARSDIYALGATLYHLLTGYKPPESLHRMVGQEKTTPPRQLKRDISPRVEQVILKAMEVTTDRRFQSVSDFQSAFSGRTPPPASGRQAATGRRWWVWGIGISGVMLVGAVLLAAVLLLGDRLRGAAQVSTSATPTSTTVALVPPDPTTTLVVIVERPTVTPDVTARATILPTPVSTQLSSPTPVPTRQASATPSSSPAPTATASSAPSSTPAATPTTLPSATPTLDMGPQLFPGFVGGGRQQRP